MLSLIPISPCKSGTQDGRRCLRCRFAIAHLATCGELEHTQSCSTETHASAFRFILQPSARSKAPLGRLDNAATHSLLKKQTVIRAPLPLTRIRSPLASSGAFRHARQTAPHCGKASYLALVGDACDICVLTSQRIRCEQ